MAKAPKNATKSVAKIIDTQAADIERAKQDKIERLRNVRILQASENVNEASTPAENEASADVAETSETPAAQASDASESEASEQAPAPAGQIADLNAALSSVVSKFAPAMTEAKKAELLASDTALKAAADAFNALSDQQKDDFAQIVGLKTRRATSTSEEKAAKANAKKVREEMDPAIKALACEVFFAKEPTLEQYAKLASASAGELPAEIDWTEISPVYYIEKDRFYDVPRAKDTRKHARITPAIKARDLDMLKASIAYMNTCKPEQQGRHGVRMCRAYARLAQIALEAQNKAAVEVQP
jgi:hypothetical protein